MPIEQTTHQNLYQFSLEELEQQDYEIRDQARESRIALEARHTLMEIKAIIDAAGGAITEEDLAKTTLAEFAIIAASNKLSIRISQKGY